ncbi:unnamed protein product, partial [Cylicocyclus nassatus]
MTAEKENKTEEEHSLHFTVNHVPDLGNLFLFGFQQMMLCFSGLLIIPFLQSNLVCAGASTIELRVRLIAASFFSSGLATLLQTTFGLRLCILHGPSFSFLPPLLAFAAMPENHCSADLETIVPEAEWKAKIQMIQGSLLTSTLTFLLLGMTGFIGQIAKLVGPITITPLLLWLCFGVVPTMHEKMYLHWISIVTFCLLIAMGVFLENVRVPLPYFSFAHRKWYVGRPRIFGQFPYLLAITTAWLICYILTVTGAEPEGGEARTDKNHTVAVIAHSPWFQVPYPGQFGLPQISAGLTLGFVSSCIACAIESLGDYQTCARVSHQRPPPSSSVNRAVIFEGVGAIIAGSLGIGTGVTTYSENIALMHITRVVSRSTMQVAGVLLILAGLFTKCAAVLGSIPDAVIGGILAMGISMIAGVAIGNLQNVDLRLTRNLTVMGTAVLMGAVIPYHFDKSKVNTG